MNTLNDIFPDETVKLIKECLQNAFISEIYDNAIDLTIPTPEGDFIFGVYCYYSDEDEEKVMAGYMDYDTDDEYYELSNDSFSIQERNTIQAIIDNYSFRKGQFQLEERDER